MLSDIAAQPAASDAGTSSCASAAKAGPTFDLGRLGLLARALNRVGHLLHSVATSPVLHSGAFMEAQALLGLPIHTPYDDQNFLWRRHNQGMLYEPDPFSAESSFQRDVWPF
jgi:hypothetical protein